MIIKIQNVDCRREFSKLSKNFNCRIIVLCKSYKRRNIKFSIRRKKPNKIWIGFNGYSYSSKRNSIMNKITNRSKLINKNKRDIFRLFRTLISK